MVDRSDGAIGASAPFALLGLDGARALAPRWAALSGDACEPNVFYTPWMLLPALERLASPAVCVAAAFDDAGVLIGLLPIAPRAVYARLPVAHVEAWRHDYCFYAAPLLKRGCERQALTRICAAAELHPSRPAFLHLTGVDADGPFARAASDRDDRFVSRTDLYDRPVWRGVASARASARRNAELRRRRARLAEREGISVRALEDARDLDGWIDDFLALEASGWKGEAGTALADGAASAGFFRDVAHAAFARDALRFLRLDAGDGPAAMTVNFVDGGAGFGFKTAYDERFAKSSPGALLLQDLSRALEREEGLSLFDSCARPSSSPAESLWADRRRIAAFNVSLNGAAGAAALSGARMVEMAARRLRRPFGD